jgi:SAM-dependent methyltransferase
MDEATSQEIDLGDLMHRIRSEIAKRRSEMQPAPASALAPTFRDNTPLSDRFVPDLLPRSEAATHNSLEPALIQLNLSGLGPKALASFTPALSPPIDVTALLALHDRAFVWAAYFVLLKRPPDEGGLSTYLRLLRTGTSKIEILRILRRSDEGRIAATPVHGLQMRLFFLTFSRWPLVGPIAAALVALSSLPSTLRWQRSADGNILSKLEEIESAADESRCTTHRALRALEDAYNRMAQVIVSDPHEEPLRNLAASTESLRDELLELSRAVEMKANRDDWQSHLDRVHSILRHFDLEKAASTDVARAETRIGEISEIVDSLARRKADIALLETFTSRLDAVSSETLSRLESYHGGLTSQIQAVRGAHEVAVAAHEGSFLGVERRLQEALEAALNSVRSTLSTLVETKLDRDIFVAAKAEVKGSLERAVADLRDTLAKSLLPVRAQAHELKLFLLDQDRRLGILLDEARRGLTDRPPEEEQLRTLATEEDHRLDATYAALEDQLRGTRTDIKERQSIYVPYIRAAGAGTDKSPILDLGCGRGEWLELLRDERLHARGVDSNRVFLQGCLERELDAVEADAVMHLRTLKPNSVGAITSFHLIEHLPLKALIALLDESFRVLKAKGIIILETPNPSNLQVGSNTFYLDPTHRNPLPPRLTQHLLEARGFSNVKILPLHPCEDWQNFSLEGNQAQLNSRLNAYFFGPQDYAAIAHKV